MVWTEIEVIQCTIFCCTVGTIQVVLVLLQKDIGQWLWFLLFGIKVRCNLVCTDSMEMIWWNRKKNGFMSFMGYSKLGFVT